MSTEAHLTPSVQSQGTAQMLEWPAPISYPCGLRIFVTKLRKLFSGRQQLTYSPTGRILVCSIVAVKNWKRYDPIPEVSYFLEKPLEAAFWGAEIL